MKALEFKTKIINNQIVIPKSVQSDIDNQGDKNIRVIILIDDAENEDELEIKKLTQTQFFKGYADEDSIYDHYKV